MATLFAPTHDADEINEHIIMASQLYIAQANEANECASTKDTKMSGNDNTSSHYQVVWCTYVIYTHSYNCNQY